MLPARTRSRSVKGATTSWARLWRFPFGFRLVVVNRAILRLLERLPADGAIQKHTLLSQTLDRTQLIAGIFSLSKPRLYNDRIVGVVRASCRKRQRDERAREFQRIEDRDKIGRPDLMSDHPHAHHELAGKVFRRIIDDELRQVTCSRCCAIAKKTCGCIVSGHGSITTNSCTRLVALSFRQWWIVAR